MVAGVKARGAGRQWGREDFGVARLDVAARDPNPPVAAVELHAVALAFFFHDAAEPRVVGRAATGVGDAVGVGVLHLIFAVGGEATGDHLHERLAFDADRAVNTQGPPRDVVVVRT